MTDTATLITKLARNMHIVMFQGFSQKLNTNNGQPSRQRVLLKRGRHVACDNLEQSKHISCMIFLGKLDQPFKKLIKCSLHSYLIIIIINL